MARLAWLKGLLAAAMTLALVTVALPATAQDVPDQGDVGDEYDYDYDLDTDPGTIDDFHDRLSPHGTWVDHPTYGTVWVPDRVVVGEDFTPYKSAGRWAVDDNGDWIWISDYSWGYIPFHYGRWVWISGSGWAWVPGRVYAPAWVEWRTGGPGYAYVGWAPMPPSYVWFGGVAVGFYGAVMMPWWYCPSAYFFSPGWYGYIVYDPVRVRHIHHHTHVYHGDHHRHASGRSGAVGRSGQAQPPHGKASGKPGGDSSFRRIPRSPSFGDAQIPKGAQPQARVKPDPRAMAMRKQPAISGAGRGDRARPATSGRRTSPSRTSPSRAVPSRRAPSQAVPSRSVPSRTTRPGLDRGDRRLPRDRATRPSPSTRPSTRQPARQPTQTRQPTRTRPRATPPPRTRQPSRSQPSRVRQAPARSAPRTTSPPRRSTPRSSAPRSSSSRRSSSGASSSRSSGRSSAGRSSGGRSSMGRSGGGHSSAGRSGGGRSGGRR
ncbi:MAG: DUF6600 domain-containing protein [Polyangiaceae bacterium]